MDNNLLWQYIAVLAIIILAIWRMIVGIRKRNRAMRKGSGCVGCSLASSCKDYKKPTQRTDRSDTSDKSSRGEEPADNDCYR